MSFEKPQRFSGVDASHPAAPVSILGFPEDLFVTEIYSLDVDEINQKHCTV